MVYTIVLVYSLENNVKLPTPNEIFDALRRLAWRKQIQQDKNKQNDPPSLQKSRSLTPSHPRFFMTLHCAC